MTVLVTGAAGFVGGAVARELARRGHFVIPCVRSGPGVNELALDLLDATGVNNALAGRSFDAVIHAAAVIPRRVGQAGESGDANVAMTRNLLSAMEDHPPGYLLTLSTIDVYGASAEPITESTPPSPVSAYAESKLRAEQDCVEWCRKTKTPLGVLRLTQVYGPGDRTHKFIPSVLRRLLAAEPVEVFGDGEDRRDYLHIDDAAPIVADMVERRYQGLLNGITGLSVSLNEVLAVLESVVARPVRVDRKPRGKVRVDRHFDAAVLSHALGERRFTPLHEGLDATLAAMRGNMTSEPSAL